MSPAVRGRGAGLGGSPTVGGQPHGTPAGGRSPERGRGAVTAVLGTVWDGGSWGWFWSFKNTPCSHGAGSRGGGGAVTSPPGEDTRGVPRGRTWGSLCVWGSLHLSPERGGTGWAHEGGSRRGPVLLGGVSSTPIPSHALSPVPPAPCCPPSPVSPLPSLVTHPHLLGAPRVPHGWGCQWPPGCSGLGQSHVPGTV